MKKERMKEKDEGMKERMRRAGVIGDQDPETPGGNGPLASRFISRIEKVRDRERV